METILYYYGLTVISSFIIVVLIVLYELFKNEYKLADFDLGNCVLGVLFPPLAWVVGGFYIHAIYKGEM